jgi:hypothetical protein
MLLRTVFLGAAFVCLVLAAFSAPIPRVNLMALGLAFWVLAELVK